MGYPNIYLLLSIRWFMVTKCWKYCVTLFFSTRIYTDVETVSQYETVTFFMKEEQDKKSTVIVFLLRVSLPFSWVFLFLRSLNKGKNIKMIKYFKRLWPAPVRITISWIYYRKGFYMRRSELILHPLSLMLL